MSIRYIKTWFYWISTLNMKLNNWLYSLFHHFSQNISTTIRWAAIKLVNVLHKMNPTIDDLLKFSPVPPAGQTLKFMPGKCSTTFNILACCCWHVKVLNCNPPNIKCYKLACCTKMIDRHWLDIYRAYRTQKHMLAFLLMLAF